MSLQPSAAVSPTGVVVDDPTLAEDAAAEPRRPSLSPSRASDFMTCPLLYRFRVIDRLPQRPSSAATRGTVVHSVLERLFDLPAIERTAEQAASMLRPEWDRLLEEEPEVGELRVVDYKTGRAPGEGFEAKAMFQMRFYALVLWRLRGEIPRVLQLLYLGSGEVLRYQPDQADLLATERKVGAIWAAISRATEERDWRPSPSRLCDWCDHQALCPAFGGTPPELPVLPVPTVPHAFAADEKPSPHTPADEV